MKKNTILLLIAVLVLVLGIMGVLREFRKKPIDPKKIVEVAINKVEVLEGSQKLDAPGIPDYIVERFDGKQKVLTEYLNNTLGDAEALLTEIRTAFVEGRVKGTYNAYAGGTNATLKTPTAEIRLTWISGDGTFRQCTKTTYSNGKELKKEELVFYDDNKTIKYYKEPGRLLALKEDGNLEWFRVDIDGKKHEIGWNTTGGIDFYRISDAQSLGPETEGN